MLKYIPRKISIHMLGDALLIIASFYLSYAVRTGEIVNVFSTYTGASVLSLFFFLFTFYIADIYIYEGRFNSVNFIFRFVITIIVANCLIAATFYVFHKWKYSRSIFLLNGLFVFFYCLSWRFIIEKYFKYKKSHSNILIMGANRAGETLHSILEENEDFKVVGFLDDDAKKRGVVIGSSAVIGDTGHLLSLLKDKSIEKVVVATNHMASSALLNELMNTKFNGVKIYDMPSFYEHIAGKIPISYINHSWLCYSNFYDIISNLYNLKIKKVLDKIVAILIITITSPVMILSMLAIKLNSKGPIFFIQERVGKSKKIINIVKLRTMKFGMEEARGLAGFRNDPRITKVGKILRFFRIDEIPQLWNVIKGDMSIIGPRSLMKEEVSRFSGKIPFFSFRQFVKPGITGWAQVNYKHGTNTEDAIEKLQYDLFYIKNLSPILDLHIFLKTVKVMLFGKGAS
ncbi:MAG: sugar transferase [Candidatus Scalinduaceae bacterium]